MVRVTRILPGAFYFHLRLFLSCPYGGWDTVLNEVLCFLLSCTYFKASSEEHLKKIFCSDKNRCDEGMDLQGGRGSAQGLAA